MGLCVKGDPSPKTEKHKITGLILAGGQSRRMGRDKAGLMYRGRSLLDRATDLLKHLPVGDIVVLGREDTKYGVRDTEPHLGPARAIRNWLRRQDKPMNLLVIPVDMPELGREQLHELLAHEKGAYFHDLYLPFYVRAAKASAVHASAERMRDLISAFDLRELPVPVHWRSALMNINTPDDLLALEERQRG